MLSTCCPPTARAKSLELLRIYSHVWWTTCREYARTNKDEILKNIRTSHILLSVESDSILFCYIKDLLTSQRKYSPTAIYQVIKYQPFREFQTRPNFRHLPPRDAPKDQNKHVQIRAPSWKTPQRRTYSRRGVQIRVGWSPLKKSLTLPENNLGIFWLADCLRYMRMPNYRPSVTDRKWFWEW